MRPPGADDAKRLADRCQPHVEGHLVQQEEQQRAILAGGGVRQGRGIRQTAAHGAVGAQLASQVVDLHRQHIDDFEFAGIFVAHRPARGQVAIDAGDLQAGAGKVVTESVERFVAQAREIAPQNQIDQPLPLETANRFGRHVGPVVGLLQIGGRCGMRGKGAARGAGVGKAHVVLLLRRILNPMH